MTSFFISYSRNIQDEVKALTQDLVDLGHDVWVDHKLTGGQTWWDEILKQIRACDVFIFAISPDTLNSEACKLEFAYAHSVNRPRLPVKLAKVSDRLLPDNVAKLHHVDYVNADPTAVKALVKAISELPKAPDLPNPLPGEPDVPMSYLGRLRERIEKPELCKDEQNSIYAELAVKVHDGEDIDDIKDLIEIFLARTDNYAITEKNLVALQSMFQGGYSLNSVQNKNKHSRPANDIELELESSENSNSIETKDALHFKAENAESSIERILQAVVGESQTWVIESDEQNKITLTTDAQNSRRQLCAQVKCRDKVTGSRQECFKKLGWETKDQAAIAGLAAGALAYATGGAALLALGSKKVRDYMLAFEATRGWTISRQDSELSKIAVEICRILDQLTNNDVPLMAWRNSQA